MPTLGFLNHVSTQPEATEIAYMSIREHHPDAPFFFSVDGVENWDNYSHPSLYENTEWLFNKEKLGYPPYNRFQIIEWLRRTYIAILKLDCDFVQMVEDDCLIINPIQIDPTWELAGHVITEGNKIDPFILTEIERISKVKPKTDYYGAGGGSIFKSSTFLENYHRITAYIKQWWGLYELKYFPQCGYMDCFLNLFYLLCGKDYLPNFKMKNLDPHNAEENIISRTYEKEQIEELYKNDFDIIHNWKRYYS